MGYDIGIDETLPERVIRYGYDPLGRLITATYSTGESFEYAYSAVGNRTVYTATTPLAGTVVTTYTYDAANRLLLSSAPLHPISYIWDARGNLTNDGVFTYTYNSAGRLVRAQSLTSTLLYTYTADGLRVAQSVGVEQSVFAWDWATAVPELLQTCNLQSAICNLHLVGHETLGQWDGATWTYYLPDALGSIRQTVNAAGAVVDTREWTPYGVEVGAAQAGPGYTGEWWDAGVGLLYLRAQWLDVATGRFTQRDPWRGNVYWSGTLNNWAYVTNNPANFVDPSGLCPDGDPECEVLGKLSPIIVENARKFNQHIFTNMTDNGFAAMLGAKILYEGELPGGSQPHPTLEKLPELLDRCDLFDFLYRLLKHNRDPLYRGASFGIANVYFDQAAQSAWWWRDLVNRRGVYGLDLQESWLETRYYEVWELEDLWYRQPVFPGTQPAPSPWNSRRTLIDELRTAEGSIQFQALEILHQGWKIYEGPPERWGENLGTPTTEISAFRIAMGVLSNAPEPIFWDNNDPSGFQMSERWVGLMPRAASCLGLVIVSGIDYLPLGGRDISRLAELGYNPVLP